MIDLSQVYEIRNVVNDKVIDKIEDDLGNVLYEAFSSLTISGIPPLTLLKSKGADLIDYKIYGNSVQDGTPTPDTPIEIESVGEETANLFDVYDVYPTTYTYEVDEEGWITSSYDNSAGTGTVWRGIYTNASKKIKPNTSYRIIAEIAEINNCNLTAVSSNATYNPGQFGVGKNFDSVGIHVFTATSRSDLSIAKTMIRTEMVVPAGKIANVKCRISVLEDTSITADTFKYEPYGYKIPVTVRGKNLFDIESYETILDKENRPYIDISKLNIGATYTISTNDTFLFKIASSSGANVQTEGGAVSSTNVNTFTFVLKDTYKSLGHLYIISTKTWKPLTKEELRNQIAQLEESSIPTDYEPYVEPITTNIYLKEPLRKVGDYKDYIDFELGEVVRNIAYKKITSSLITQKSSASTENFHYYFINFSGAMAGVRIPLLSNIGGGSFSDFNTKTKEGIFSNTNITFFIAFFDITTLEEARQFVTDNEVYANYILASPKYEIIQLPNIPTIKGTTVIEVNTSIKPSNMEVTYLGKQS